MNYYTLLFNFYFLNPRKEETQKQKQTRKVSAASLALDMQFMSKKTAKISVSNFICSFFGCCLISSIKFGFLPTHIYFSLIPKSYVCIFVLFESIFTLLYLAKKLNSNHFLIFLIFLWNNNNIKKKNKTFSNNFKNYNKNADNNNNNNTMNKTQFNQFFKRLIKLLCNSFLLSIN